jgi:hypothetical protein
MRVSLRGFRRAVSKGDLESSEFCSDGGETDRFFRDSGAPVAPKDCSRTGAMQISGTQMRLLFEISVALFAPIRKDRQLAPAPTKRSANCGRDWRL